MNKPSPFDVLKAECDKLRGELEETRSERDKLREILLDAQDAAEIWVKIASECKLLSRE